MASSYGLNFGFRRSDETVRVSEGRFRTPKTGTALLLGTVVEVDPSNAGYVKQSAANAKLVTGYCGLLLQEEDHLRSIYDSEYYDSTMFGTARKGALSVITSGAGTKVWFKNTAVQNRADGRTVPAVTVATVAGLVVGDQLGWDGTKFIKLNGTTVTTAVLTVTDVKTSAGYVEGVLVA